MRMTRSQFFHGLAIGLMRRKFYEYALSRGYDHKQKLSQRTWQKLFIAWIKSAK